MLGLELGADDYMVKPFSPNGAGGPHARGARARTRPAAGRAVRDRRARHRSSAGTPCTVDDARGRAHAEGVRSAAGAGGGAGARRSRGSTCWIACGAMPRRGRSSRAPWMSTCGGCAQKLGDEGAAHRHRDRGGLPPGGRRVMRALAPRRPPPNRAQAHPDPGRLRGRQHAGGRPLPQPGPRGLRGGLAGSAARHRRPPARTTRRAGLLSRSAGAEAIRPSSGGRRGPPGRG